MLLKEGFNVSKTTAVAANQESKLSNIISGTFSPLPFQSIKSEKIKSPLEKRWKTAKLLSLLAPIAISEIKNWKGSIKQKGDNNLIIPPISTSKKSSTKY